MKNALNSIGIILIATALVWIPAVSSAEPEQKPTFSMKDMQGHMLRLSDFRGKWVFVNFWATWCPPCLEEIPDLVNFYDKHHDKDAVVIGVVTDYASLKEVNTFVDDMLISYPVVLGEPQVIQQIGRAEVLPSTYIYNPKGELVTVKRGLMSRQYLEKIVSSR